MRMMRMMMIAIYIWSASRVQMPEYANFGAGSAWEDDNSNPLNENVKNNLTE